MLLGLLLTLNILICLALVGVVLLQRSEGGALGTGGPTGLITTRGAGDLLTRTTWVLFTLFLVISLALTLLGGRERSSQAILNRLKGQSVNPDALALPAAPVAPTPTITGAPLTNPPATTPALPSATLPPAGVPAAAPTRARRAAPAPSKALSAPLPTVHVPTQAAASAPAAPAPTAAPVAAPSPKIDITPKPLTVPSPPAAKEAAPPAPSPATAGTP